jgi:hypothetical protein
MNDVPIITPRLVSKEMGASMRPGSVIADLAVERGGSVEGAKPGEVVQDGEVKIVGYLNVPSRLAASASAAIKHRPVRTVGLGRLPALRRNLRLRGRLNRWSNALPFSETQSANRLRDANEAPRPTCHTATCYETTVS